MSTERVLAQNVPRCTVKDCSQKAALTALEQSESRSSCSQSEPAPGERHIRFFSDDDSMAVLSLNQLRECTEDMKRICLVDDHFIEMYRTPIIDAYARKQMLG